MDNSTVQIITSVITITTNGIITLASSSGLFLLLKNVLPAYFTEKGKNLATREDIGEITQEVERVKEEFTSKAEQLRIDLQYFNQVRYSLKTEERNAIVNCYEKYSLWISLLTSFSFSDFSTANIDDLAKPIDALNSAYLQVMLAEAKMALFTGRGDFTSEFSELKIIVLHFQNYTLAKALDHRRNLSMSILTESSLAPTDFAGKRKESQELHSLTMVLMTEWRNKMLEQYKIIARKEAQWQANILVKLTALPSQVTQN